MCIRDRGFTMGNVSSDGSDDDMPAPGEDTSVSLNPMPHYNAKESHEAPAWLDATKFLSLTPDADKRITDQHLANKRLRNRLAERRLKPLNPPKSTYDESIYFALAVGLRRRQENAWQQIRSEVWDQLAVIPDHIVSDKMTVRQWMKKTKWEPFVASGRAGELRGDDFACAVLLAAVSYTHLTLPTKRIVVESGAARDIRNKKGIE
eukprot:TRINITY_DN46599_c0_g2_i1.p1 TRINITY_DN46599_c0_g2~~TRINITY_DN46599_c0_g2_i1.p1  ORF type:complete len:236 (+),score=44.96 TRINITY_DN46599_c0_g2_i1:92-709(+)